MSDMPDAIENSRRDNYSCHELSRCRILRWPCPNERCACRGWQCGGRQEVRAISSFGRSTSAASVRSASAAIAGCTPFTTAIWPRSGERHADRDLSVRRARTFWPTSNQERVQVVRNRIFKVNANGVRRGISLQQRKCRRATDQPPGRSRTFSTRIADEVEFGLETRPLGSRQGRREHRELERRDPETQGRDHARRRIVERTSRASSLDA